MGIRDWLAISAERSAGASMHPAPATPGVARGGPSQRRELAIPVRADGVTLPATPSSSLTLPTLYRCVTLLAHTVQQLDLKSRTGAPVPVWLARPEFYGPLPLRQLIGYWTSSLALHGSMAGWAQNTGDGWQLRAIHPERVTWKTRPNGVAPDDSYPELDGKPVPLALPGLSGLIFRPYLTVPGVAGGLGPVQAARQALGHSLSVDAYGGDVYGNGVPEGVLTTDQPIDPETAGEIKTDWLAADEQRIRVLGQGLKFDALKLSPRDAAWLEAREYNAKDVARLFGIPAFMLDLPAGDSMTYQNTEDSWNQYLRLAVMPIVNAIEDSLNLMLGPMQAIDLVPETLLRPTLGERAKVAESLSRAGIAPELIAELLGLPAPTSTATPVTPVMEV